MFTVVGSKLKPEARH